MIYIHFPFCKSFCTYCDFYSVRGKDRMAQYTQSLLREISLRKAFLCRCASPATLYVGGGTPSLWPVEQLGEAVAAISAALREGGRGRRATDVPAVLYVRGGTPSLWPVEQLGEAVAVVTALLREGAAELSREHGMAVGRPGSLRNLPSRSIRTMSRRPTPGLCGGSE